MRERISVFLLLCVVSPGIWARGIEDFVSALSRADDYHARGRLEVYLPSAQEPVAYDISLISKPNPTDSLSPCSYLIDWRSADPDHPSAGFTAYFDGNFYRFRGDRLQEYHTSATPAAFAPGGDTGKGVQQQAQFVSLLPQFLARELRNPEYTYNIIDPERSATIEGQGAGREFVYRFNPATLLPVSATVTFNPGTLSEQTTSWQVQESLPTSSPTDFSEEWLREQYPDAFGRYRSSTFRAESLKGEALPTFSVPVAGTRERFAHRKGDPMEALTLVVFLDPEVATAAGTVAQVREAASQAPVPVHILWAFPTTNSAEEILDLLGQAREGEVALSSARSLASDCGVTLFPTLILVGKDGMVKDVTIGANQDLSAIVIQKIIISN